MKLTAIGRAESFPGHDETKELFVEEETQNSSYTIFFAYVPRAEEVEDSVNLFGVPLGLSRYSVSSPVLSVTVAPVLGLNVCMVTVKQTYDTGIMDVLTDIELRSPQSASHLLEVPPGDPSLAYFPPYERVCDLVAPLGVSPEFLCLELYREAKDEEWFSQRLSALVELVSEGVFIEQPVEINSIVYSWSSRSSSQSARAASVCESQSTWHSGGFSDSDLSQFISTTGRTQNLTEAVRFGFRYLEVGEVGYIDNIDKQSFPLSWVEIPRESRPVIIQLINKVKPLSTYAGLLITWR